jgi:hypothetical protein
VSDNEWCDLMLLWHSGIAGSGQVARSLAAQYFSIHPATGQITLTAASGEDDTQMHYQLIDSLRLQHILSKKEKDWVFHKLGVS